MAVVRTQFAFESALVASVAGTSSQVYTLSRPVTTADNPATSDTIDFVALPRTRLEFNQGKVSVFANAAILAYATGAFVLRTINILDINGNVLRTPLSVTDNAFDLTLVGTQQLLQSFILAEGEISIQLTCFNTTGGALTNSQFTARADFGLNSANYGATLVPSSF
jgi:hypothetical protein